MPSWTHCTTIFRKSKWHSTVILFRFLKYLTPTYPTSQPSIFFITTIHSVITTPSPQHVLTTPNIHRAPHHTLPYTSLTPTPSPPTPLHLSYPHAPHSRLHSAPSHARSSLQLGSIPIYIYIYAHLTALSQHKQVQCPKRYTIQCPAQVHLIVTPQP